MFRKISYSLILLIILSACNKKVVEIKEEQAPENSELIAKILTSSSDDKELLPELIAFINTPINQQWKNNAHVYLWGMSYQSDDTYHTGLEIAQQLAVLNEQYDYQGNYKDDFLDQYTSIELPSDDDVCRFRDPGCFIETVNALESRSALAEKFTGFEEKYLHFMSIEHYSNTTGWVLDDNFKIPPYRHLTHGMHFYHIRLLNDLKKGNKSLVLSELTQEALNMRRRLAQADSLIGKMIFSHMYSEHLELINGSLALGWLEYEDLKKLPSLEPFDKDILSTETIWNIEERVKVKMLQIAYDADKTDGLYINMFYPDLEDKMVKPNVTLNTLYTDLIVPVKAYQNQSPEAFYQGLENFDIEIQFDEIENAVGILFNITKDEVISRYLMYQDRMHALNMKTQLLRALVEQGAYQKIIVEAKQMYKPYLNHYDETAPFIEGNKICYEVINVSNKRFSCLYIYDVSAYKDSSVY